MTDRIEAAVLFRPSDEELRFLPEGPYPLGASLLSWVAIQHGPTSNRGSLNIFNLASGENQSFALPGRPGFAFPCDDGERFLVGCERQLGLFHPTTSQWQTLVDHIDSNVEGTIINDAVIHGDNVVFGTKDLQFSNKKAGLYLYRGRDSRLIQLRDDQICSNGKAIRSSSSGLELIDIDSPTRRIVAYPIDFDAGSLGNPRTVVDLTADGAVPDGAILTPRGDGVIVSMYNPDAAPAGETREYSLADGTLRRVWLTPGSPQNTCPNLVEHQGEVHLVITTAVEHMPEDRWADSPNAGCLFHAPTGFESVGAAPRFPVSSRRTSY